MHDIRDYKIKGYVKILLIVLVMAGIMPIGVGYSTPSMSTTSWGNNATNNQNLKVGQLDRLLMLPPEEITKKNWCQFWK